jgi:fructose-1,6-bisphosphatase/inositol monophosphatase family enzyme
MGFRANAAINATNQALQEAEGQRRRADQLARRCRRLRSVTAAALTATVVGMGAAFALGGIVGYAFGAGLLGLVGR